MSTEFERTLQLMSENFRAELPSRHKIISDLLSQIISNYSIAKCELLKQKLHQLTGSAGTFGLHEVSAASRELEIFVGKLSNSNNLHAEDKKLLIELFNVLSLEVDKVTSKQYIDKLPIIRTDGFFEKNRPKQLENGKKSIVIIDSKRNLFFYQSILNEESFELTLFSEPNFNVLTEFYPSILIVSIDLNTEHEGSNYIQKLQDLNETLPPVIFISEKDCFKCRLDAVRSGGTRFLTFPFPDEDLLNSVLSLTNEDLEPYRVLIIDDEVEVTDYFDAVLNKVGIVTSVVNTPYNTIEEVNKFRPELILMDLHMQGCNGLELAAMIRHQEDYSQLPIVFLSSDYGLENRLSAMTVGADDFIAKGIEPYQIIASIKSRVKRSRLINTLTYKLMLAREKAEKANESKSRFLSFVSHELKTPLNAILGYTDMLKYGDLSEEQIEMISEIRASGKMQLELIHDLLDLTMIEEGKVTLNISTLFFNDILNSAISLISIQAQARNIQLEIDIEDEVLLDGDQKRIQQILLNLLSNAVKYNKENGTIKVIVEKNNTN